jgi:phosphohistidine phosphatase
LAREGFIADHALVSAAHRAVGTWRYVAEGADWELEPTLSQGLYSAGPESALDLVRESPAAAAAVVVVGHNPTMAYLASLLDDGDGDPEVASAMLAGYPTSAVAVFEYDGEWVDLDEGGARLVGFHVGRG